MNDEEQLGALYSIAQKQQEATGDAVKALQHQTATVAQAIKTLAGLPGQVSENLRGEAKKAVDDAMSSVSSLTVDKAQQAADRAAENFAATARHAAQAAQDAATAAREASTSVNWLYLALAFVIGLSIGAGGLYVLRKPTATVYLDTDKIIRDVSAACKRR